jgi:hypothetical protein
MIGWPKLACVAARDKQVRSSIVGFIGLFLWLSSLLERAKNGESIKTPKIS